MNTEVHSTTRKHCVLCGKPGRLLYEKLRDRLFGARGEWDVRCCTGADCGMLWMDPMPGPEDLAQAYENYYTHAAASDRAGIARRAYRAMKRGYIAGRYRYRATSLERVFGKFLYAFPMRRRWADEEARYLGCVPGGRLLDIGCGSGEWLERMMRFGWKGVGCDFDPAAVAEARRKSVDARLGSVEAQEFEDASFDAITLNHVIEHLQHPLNTLRECVRLLKPGGRLVVATPNAESFSHRHFGPNWRGLEPPRHLALFTPKALLRALAEAGFAAATVQPQIAESVWYDSLLLRGDSGDHLGSAASRPWLSMRAKLFSAFTSVLCAAKPEAADCFVAMACKPGDGSKQSKELDS